ncbi:MAG: hypothetical protein J1E33_06295 [Alistipes sp.]|nr:hypothetical protein [Alistipes sp.]
MTKTTLRKSTDDAKCCGECRYFYDEGVYGDGECAVHPDICAYCEDVCNEFQPKYYGDDEGRPE